MDSAEADPAAVAAAIAAARAAAVAAFWRQALNGTPPYCTPYNTLPLFDPSMASSWLWVGEISAILPIVFLPIGLVINLCFLFVISRAPTMRTGINVYLGNLAVVDVAYLTLVGGVFIDRMVAKPAAFHETIAGCYLVSGADGLSFYASVGMITMGTVYHLSSRMSNAFANGKGGTGAATTLTWLFAIGLGILSAMQWGKMFLICVLWPRMPEFAALPFTFTKCGPGPIGDEHYALYLDLVKTGVFAAALLINVVLYAMICTKSSPDDLDRRIHSQVFRLLVCNGLVFFLCQTASHTLNVINALQEFGEEKILDDTQQILMQIIANMFLYLNPAIRPVIYCLCSGGYRKAVVKAFTGGGSDDEGADQKDNSAGAEQKVAENM